MLVDMHVHSFLSRECHLTPRAVLDRAQSHGLDGVAFTETNTVDGCDEIFAAAKGHKVRAFVGLEVWTDKGQYLCFFADPNKVPEPVQLFGSNKESPWSADVVLPKMKSLGAAIVAARPFDKDFDYPAHDFVKGLKDLCGVETYNARVRMGFNEMATETAVHMQLPGVGGSDARSSLDEIGFGATLFRAPIESQKELIAALGKGEFWPVMMGELPRLTQPGEAKQADAKSKRRRRRRWS